MLLLVFLVSAFFCIFTCFSIFLILHECHTAVYYLFLWSIDPKEYSCKSEFIVAKYPINTL